ncbi:MAG: DUF3489 domain-containing protein [Planctomycetaceae bacterium]|nr:DUF3489 domain-containing protein [Planctomycetaceae bacterium]
MATKKPTTKSKTTKKPARKPPHNKLKRPTNDERLLRFLSRPGGTTIEDMRREIKMQAHSIRGCMSNLRKKTGIEITYDRETKRYSMV